MSTSMPVQTSDRLDVPALSVVLIGPDDHRRRGVALALASGSQARVAQEIHFYPELDDVSELVGRGYDVIILDLDSDRETALDLVEQICARTQATVMVYSSETQPELLVRCMRAGAREFLRHPVDPNQVQEALVRASVRRAPAQHVAKAAAELFVFAAAKGGSGVTTLATNFGIALAKESGKRTLLIDLASPLGAAAIELGVTSQFTTESALANVGRLDGTFLTTLLAEHSSGLSVLCAPDHFSEAVPSEESLNRLISIARQQFDYVIVDVGAGLTNAFRSLLQGATRIYVVTQISVSDLRNANRLITHFFSPAPSSLEIVVNRHSSGSAALDEESISKALTRPVAWRVPSDYETVQTAQNTATPLALGNTAVAQVIRRMARSAAGLSEVQEKKKRFSLFG